MATTRPDAEILLRLAGPFAALRAGVPLPGADLGSRKARLLLKVLAAEAGHALPVARLSRSSGPASRRRAGPPRTSRPWSAGCESRWGPG